MLEPFEAISTVQYNSMPLSTTGSSSGAGRANVSTTLRSAGPGDITVKGVQMKPSVSQALMRTLADSPQSDVNVKMTSHSLREDAIPQSKLFSPPIRALSLIVLSLEPRRHIPDVQSIPNNLRPPAFECHRPTRSLCRIAHHVEKRRSSRIHRDERAATRVGSTSTAVLCLLMPDAPAGDPFARGIYPPANSGQFPSDTLDPIGH